MTKKGWYQQARHVLGSDANLKLGDIEQPFADTVFDAMWAVIADFETRFSRFKVESELSRFNARAGEWIIVSKEFRALLVLCQHYSVVTKGLFNPFILPALQQAGYRGSWPRAVKGDQRLYVGERQVAPMKALVISGDRAKIPANAAIDVGGIGKGYMLDTLAGLLEKMGVRQYCLSLGGDIIYQGFAAGGQPWPVMIDGVPKNNNTPNAIVNRTGQRLGVATSGVTRRAGLGWNHLIDPRTGLSVEALALRVTVIANSGTQADVFAKTCLLDSAVGASLNGLLGLFEQYSNGKCLVKADAKDFFVTKKAL